MFKLVLVLIVISLNKLVVADICNVCNCYKRGSNELNIDCQGVANDKFKIDLENIEWPSVIDKKIFGNFDNLNLTVLPRILGDQNVISLSFNDNLLRTIVSSPFSHFKSLEMLFLNNNDITELPKGITNMKLYRYQSFIYILINSYHNFRFTKNDAKVATIEHF